MVKAKGYRIVAAIYENERQFRQNPEDVWGYRIFDELGKKKAFDVSVKDLLSAGKKDVFNAISMHCHHAHLVKSGGTLQISCEDGNLDLLPHILRDNTLLQPALPIVYELGVKDGEVVEYGIVSHMGVSKHVKVEDLKRYILVNLNGKVFLERGVGPLKGYNLTMYTRKTAKSVSYVLTRATYDFPEVVLK